MSEDKIIIAVDDSSYSEEAFEWYFAHMHRPENKVTLVHCIEMPSVPSRDSWDAQTKAGREKGKEVENKYAAKLQAHQTSGTFTNHFEKPGEYIVELAKTSGATIIIMGTRGMGRIRRTILGSVSEYVLHHAHCPVLVVRPSKEAK